MPELSVDQIRQQLEPLLNAANPNPNVDESYMSCVWVRDLFPTSSRCVYNAWDGKLYEQAYTVNGLEIALSGSPVEVMVSYQSAADAAATPPAGSEAAAPAEQPVTTSLAAAVRSTVQRFDSSEHLKAAMLAAAQEGDHETTGAVASIIKKKASDSPDAGGMPAAPIGEIDKEVKEAKHLETPIVPGPLYTAAQTQLETLYPAHEFQDEADGAVIIEVEKDGALTYWSIPVTLEADGSATLGTASEVQPAPEEVTPPAVVIPPEALGGKPNVYARGKRQFFSHIEKTLLKKGSNSAWVNLVNLGSYVHDTYGEINFTEADFQSWKTNLERGAFGGLGADGKPSLAADYGHAMDADGVPAEQQKASGYIKELKLEGEKVFGLVEFTDPAADGIRAGEWSWWSISAAPGVTDQRTGEDTGPVLIGGALTNRPFIPGLEAIQLSDLRPTRVALLEREVKERETKIALLERTAFDTSLAANLATLTAHGVPPAVIALARPALEADRDAAATIKLSRSGKESFAKPGAILMESLLELAKLQVIPLGERTTVPAVQAPGSLEITLTRAADELQLERPSLRRSDAILLARKKYPHLTQQ